MDSQVIEIVGAAIAGGGILQVGLKIIESIKTQKMSQKYTLDKSVLDAELEHDLNFQERIVNKSFDAYISQNTRVMDMFDDKIKDLITLMEELNRLSRDSYSQVEILRREIKTYEKSALNSLSEMKGLMEKMRVTELMLQFINSKYRTDPDSIKALEEFINSVKGKDEILEKE